MALHVGARLPTGGPALVFGPGRNPIAFVSARDVAAVVDLTVPATTLDELLERRRLGRPTP